MILTSDKFEEAISSGVCVVDFFANWCGPCRMLAPILEDVEKKLNGKAKVYKIDVDEAEEICKEFGIMSIPTLIFFKDGKEMDKIIGLKSEDEIIETVNKLL